MQHERKGAPLCARLAIPPAIRELNARNVRRYPLGKSVDDGRDCIPAREPCTSSAQPARGSK
jgi:hypothetical protein